MRTIFGSNRWKAGMTVNTILVVLLAFLQILSPGRGVLIRARARSLPRGTAEELGHRTSHSDFTRPGAGGCVPVHKLAKISYAWAALLAISFGQDRSQGYTGMIQQKQKAKAAATLESSILIRNVSQFC